jgi:hypothetical protein
MILQNLTNVSRQGELARAGLCFQGDDVLERCIGWSWSAGLVLSGAISLHSFAVWIGMLVYDRRGLDSLAFEIVEEWGNGLMGACGPVSVTDVQVDH